MKYLKKFENLNLLKQWGFILSDEEFQNIALEFDKIIEPFLEYTDEGHLLKFETAYGERVLMRYEDYLAKNDKYKEFINGLPAKGLFFNVILYLPNNYENLINFLSDFNSSVGRINDLGWRTSEFKISGSYDNRLVSKYIILNYEFRKNK
jgi:hypothetical protein